jgi:hypothetical protein
MEKACRNKKEKMSLNILLISPDMLKDRTAIHSNIDEKLLYPTIKVCQDMYIHPLLGSALYNKIINLVDTGNVSGVTYTDYKTLLDDYIVDTLCWYVLSKAIFDVTYQMYNKGVIKKQGDSTDLLGVDELEALRNEYRIRAEYYGERLRKYLIATATTSILPEYFTGNNTADALNPQGSSFSMPVYLGPEYECCYNGVTNKCNCGHDHL